MTAVPHREFQSRRYPTRDLAETCRRSANDTDLRVDLLCTHANTMRSVKTAAEDFLYAAVTWVKVNCVFVCSNVVYILLRCCNCGLSVINKRICYVILTRRPEHKMLTEEVIKGDDLSVEVQVQLQHEFHG